MSAIRAIRLLPTRSAIFVCDVQTKFKDIIYGFNHVVATGNKMLRIAKELNIPVIVSEQNNEKLGHTVEELSLGSLGPLLLGTFNKSRFSTPELSTLLSKSENQHIRSVILFGIESHICVLQTALDLLQEGYEVHVLADGVSSCNKEEVPWALERMRQNGAQITTSESASFDLMGDAFLPNFKAFANIIKEEKNATKAALEVLLPVKKA